MPLIYMKNVCQFFVRERRDIEDVVHRDDLRSGHMTAQPESTLGSYIRKIGYVVQYG